MITRQFRIQVKALLASSIFVVPATGQISTGPGHVGPHKPPKHEMCLCCYGIPCCAQWACEYKEVSECGQLIQGHCVTSCDSCGDTGACCEAGGSCSITTEDDCGGTYLGDGSDCGPTGACCGDDGSCTVSTENCCTGTFHTGESCSPTGACCKSEGECVETTEECCGDVGGTFYSGSNCSPTGACCKPDGTCTSTIEACCSEQGGTFHVEGSCDGTSACCKAGGECTQTTEQCCGDVGGTYHSGSACFATSPCCTLAGDCVETTQECCEDEGGTQAPGASCDTGTCCVPGQVCQIMSEACCQVLGGTFSSGSSPCFHNVNVRYNTFIRCDYIEATYPGPFWPFYKGDNRIFNQSGTSRTHQQCSMTVDPAFPTGMIGSPVQGADPSHGYNTLLDPGPQPGWCPNMCRFFPSPGQMPNCSQTSPGSWSMMAQRISDKEVKVHIVVDALAGCATPGITPTIDATLDVHFKEVCDAAGQNHLYMKIDGQFDQFPWHELLIDSWVYRIIDPCALGTDGFYLMGPMITRNLPWVQLY